MSGWCRRVGSSLFSIEFSSAHFALPAGSAALHAAFLVPDPWRVSFVFCSCTFVSSELSPCVRIFKRAVVRCWRERASQDLHNAGWGGGGGAAG